MEIFCTFSSHQPSINGEIICKYEVTHVNRIASSGRILGVSTFHIDGKSCKDVQSLSIFSQELNYFPQKLCTYFPNLQSISITGCGIRSLSKFDLIGCEGIKTLILDNNRITSLSEDVFDHAKNLENISFRNNKIEFVDENAFVGLKNLKAVNFMGNSATCWKNGKSENSRKVNGNPSLFEALKYLESYGGSVPCMKDEVFNTHLDLALWISKQAAI